MPQATNINVRSIAERYQENCRRIEEMAELCERENRPRNEAETAEFETLQRDNQILAMRIAAAQAGAPSGTPADPDAQLRERIRANQSTRFLVTRAAQNIQTSAALEDTGIIPVNEQELLTPLRAGLIYDKVGLTIRTGLSGFLRWPKHSKAVATFADEGVAIGDSHIDFAALEAKPQRLGIAIPVTREELFQSEGLVESIIRSEMPLAIADCINAVMFTTEANGEDGKAKRIVGPFVEAAKTAVQFAGELPTRKELLKMRARVLREGITLVNPAWVMTEDMKAELEDLKVDAGSGRFVCENDQILGHPVFTTPAIGDGNIGFGDWSYQAAGFFGQMDFVVDPYTLARNHAVDFVLNANFLTVTLRPEAFVLGKAKTANP